MGAEVIQKTSLYQMGSPFEPNVREEGDFYRPVSYQYILTFQPFIRLSSFF